MGPYEKDRGQGHNTGFRCSPQAPRVGLGKPRLGHPLAICFFLFSDEETDPPQELPEL